MADDRQRIQITPLQAEALLKALMTEVWTAGKGQLTVEFCVDKAIELARDRHGMVTPDSWRDRFVQAAKQVLKVRKETAPLEIEVVDASRKEFEDELKKHPQGMIHARTDKKS